MSEIQCTRCFRKCVIAEGQTGFCRARKNVDDRNICSNAGQLTSIALDAIEKKPLKRFYPGSKILSVGSYGCNLSCPFCQNSSISMTDAAHAYYENVSAEMLAEMVLEIPDNLGIAFTYNEPLLYSEYMIETAERIRPYGKKVVVVSNGTASKDVLKELMPYVDAMNIDLKGSDIFYKEIGGDLQMVKDTIEYVYDKCHLEVTTLVIPGKNDSDEFITEESRWLSSLSKDIPLHLSRYFPRYKYHIHATDPEVIYRLRTAALKYLNYVYTGNIF